MLGLYRVTREAVLRRATHRPESFTSLEQVLNSKFLAHPQSKRFNASASGSGGDTESPGDGLPSIADRDPNAEPFQFPDPSDPHQHPLAPLASEDFEQRQEHLKQVSIATKPQVYKRKVNEDGEAYAIGSRKRSKAKVWLRPGTGQITVNGRPWVDYFCRLDQRDKILEPFGLLQLIGTMDVKCEVRGGGTTGQTEAFRHGLARALQNWDPQYRPTMKQHGFLTRDGREVEPKKYGKKKARKSFQWVKR